MSDKLVMFLIQASILHNISTSLVDSFLHTVKVGLSYYLCIKIKTFSQEIRITVPSRNISNLLTASTVLNNLNSSSLKWFSPSLLGARCQPPVTWLCSPTCPCPQCRSCQRFQCPALRSSFLLLQSSKLLREERCLFLSLRGLCR